MSKIIVYGSRYGCARGYAEELSSRTGIRAVSFRSGEDLSRYDTIVYFGGLYAGGLLGFRQTIKALNLERIQTFLLVTVGLSDPADEENRLHIRQSLSKQIPPALMEKAMIFHLRGGIDYRKLRFSHKMMMKLLYHSVKNTPPENRSADDQAMMDTYLQTVDFVDFTALEPIEESLFLNGDF